jgi:hypothetical protein
MLCILSAVSFTFAGKTEEASDDVALTNHRWLVNELLRPDEAGSRMFLEVPRTLQELESSLGCFKNRNSSLFPDGRRMV